MAGTKKNHSMRRREGATSPNSPNKAISGFPDIFPNRIILGHWKGSPVRGNAGKHAVTGTINLHGGLKLEIQTKTQFGKVVSLRHRIPPGPGGRFVGLKDIALNDAFVGMDEQQIRDYVKKRVGKQPPYPERPQIKSSHDDPTDQLREVVAAANASAANTRISIPTRSKLRLGSITYTLKQSEPFQGRYSSPGISFTIDGEKYVEYRILMKPT